MAGMKVKKGDTVQVIAGRSRSKGRVIATYPERQRVLVEGVNRIKKHTRVTTNQRGAQSGGIVTQEAPIHVSNVMVVCPSCDKPSRLGRRQVQETDESGRVKTRPVRVCKRCDTEF